MDNNERRKLNELLEKNPEAVDNTVEIREQKNSGLIKADIEKFIRFKHSKQTLFNQDRNEYTKQLQNECSFIHKNYPEMLPVLLKNNMDMKVLFTMLNVYTKIEEGSLDQHSASVEIGKLLKDIYVDPAITVSNNNAETKDVSYSQWKSMN